MNQPTTFQRSSSWTLQSYLKNKDTPQGDEKDDSFAVPKTDFLRGFSGLMDTSASFDVLPHQVERHLPSTPAKRVSIISSASDTDARSYDSDDDDSWIDALCDVPVAMFDPSIDPLPPFQDTLTPANIKQSRKRSAEDLTFPTVVTPASTNAVRRVSIEPFLPGVGAGKQFSSALKTPPPPAPKKKDPPPRPSALDSAVSLESAFDSAKIDGSVLPSTTYKPSQLFAKKVLAMKKKKNKKASTKNEPAIKEEEEPNTKMGPADEPFPSVTSSGRVRKSVKIYDPQDYNVPRKPRKTKTAIKQEEGSNKAPSENAVSKEPSKKKRKIEKSNKTDSDPLKNVRVPRKSGFAKKVVKTLNKSNASKTSHNGRKKAKSLKTNGLKVVKAGRTIRPKKGSLFIVTPTKVKSKSAPVPLKLSEIPKLQKGKQFSDIQENSWAKKYQEFLDFKEIYGHTAVPHFYFPNLKLSRWVKRQRYQYKLRLSNLPSTMTDKRITLLNEAEFIWDSHANVWMERYRELSEFVKKNGHASVASRNKNKKANCLAAWVKHQRRQYKLLQMGCSSHMTPERIDLLDKIGFQWFVRSSGSALRPRPRRQVEEFQVEDVEDVQPDEVGSNGML